MRASAQFIASMCAMQCMHACVQIYIYIYIYIFFIYLFQALVRACVRIYIYIYIYICMRAHPKNRYSAKNDILKNTRRNYSTQMFIILLLSMHCPRLHGSRHAHCACKVNLRLHACAYMRAHPETRYIL